MNHPRPIKPSLRSEIDPFRAMDVLSEANRMTARGLPVISLAVGQPAAPAPKGALAAAAQLLETGRIAYTDALGRMDLRQRIARLYREQHGVEVPVERVMITTGSSAGFNLAFLAAFDVGDRVAIAAPGYPAYRNILRALGLVPVEIEVGDDYVLGAKQLAEAHAREPLQGVLIASPANPTGTVTPKDELRRLVEFAGREGIRFVSDEIYHGLVFGEPEATALEVSDEIIVVNSFSKFYCMTGWRIGWLVLPQSLVRAAECIGQSLYISPPELSQVAALAVIDQPGELEAIRDGYRDNRAVMLERLPKLGFTHLAPMDGGFYAYAAIPPGFAGSTEFARRVLEECHVAITPGTDFDVRRGERFVRVSYACGTPSLKEALDRLEGWLGNARSPQR